MGCKHLVNSKEGKEIRKIITKEQIQRENKYQDVGLDLMIAKHYIKYKAE